MPFATEPERAHERDGSRMPRGRRGRSARGPGASGRCSARSRSPTSRARSTSTTPRASARRFGAVPNADADPDRRDARRQRGRRGVRPAAGRGALGREAHLRMLRTRRPPLTVWCGSPRRRWCSVAASNRRLREAGSHSSPTTRFLRTSLPSSSACHLRTPGAAPRSSSRVGSRRPRWRSFSPRAPIPFPIWIAAAASLSALVVRWEGGPSRVGQRCHLESCLVSAPTFDSASERMATIDSCEHGTTRETTVGEVMVAQAEDAPRGRNRRRCAEGVRERQREDASPRGGRSLPRRSDGNPGRGGSRTSWRSPSSTSRR